MVKTAFDEVDYWRTRLGNEPGLVEVGHRALGRRYNEYLYKRRVEVLYQALESIGFVSARARILEVGCGSGFYLPLWKALGVKTLLGIDVSESAIESARRRFPDYKFRALDFSQNPLEQLCEEPATLVTIFDVLYHITDDAPALNVMLNAASTLVGGGHLLLFENIVSRDYSIRSHVKLRSNQTHLAFWRTAGFELVKRIPLYILLEPPVYASKFIDYPIWGAYWCVGAIMRKFEFIGHLIGRAMYNLDRLLLKGSFRTPNHEILILRKIA